MFRALRKHLTPSTFIAFLALVFAVHRGAPLPRAAPVEAAPPKRPRRALARVRQAPFATAAKSKSKSKGKGGRARPRRPQGRHGGYRPRGSYRSSGPTGSQVAVKVKMEAAGATGEPARKGQRAIPARKALQALLA